MHDTHAHKNHFLIFIIFFGLITTNYYAGEESSDIIIPEEELVNDLRTPFQESLKRLLLKDIPQKSSLKDKIKTIDNLINFFTGSNTIKEEDHIFFRPVFSTEIQTFFGMKTIHAQGPSEYLRQVLIVALQDYLKIGKKYYVDPNEFLKKEDLEKNKRAAEELDEKKRASCKNILVRPFFSTTNENLEIVPNYDKDAKNIIKIALEIFSSLIPQTCWHTLPNLNLFAELQDSGWWEVLANGALRKYSYFMKKKSGFRQYPEYFFRYGSITDALSDLVNAARKLNSLSSKEAVSSPYSTFKEQLTEKLNKYIEDGKNKEAAENLKNYIVSQVESTISFLWHQHRLKTLLGFAGTGIVGSGLLYKYRGKIGEFLKRTPQKLPSTSTTTPSQGSSSTTFTSPLVPKEQSWLESIKEILTSPQRTDTYPITK